MKLFIGIPKSKFCHLYSGIFVLKQRVNVKTIEMILLILSIRITLVIMCQTELILMVKKIKVWGSFSS